MCLLTFFPEGVMPDTDALLNGAAVNRDGHGFAVVAGDRLLVQRGFDGEQMVEAFGELRSRHREGPAMFHSRFSTHGERTIDNCHPFTVGGDHRTVLAHNGVLPRTVHPATNDPRSDTRIAAEDFLPIFGSLRTRRARLRFERWMTPRNLAVILTVDRRFRRRAYIFNEASGSWDGKIWYSNEGYLPLPPSWPDPRWDQWWELSNRAAGACSFCQAPVGLTADECPYCGGCPDCGEADAHCLCYRPTASDESADAAPPPLVG